MKKIFEKFDIIGNNEISKCRIKSNLNDSKTWLTVGMLQEENKVWVETGRYTVGELQGMLNALAEHLQMTNYISNKN